MRGEGREEEEEEFDDDEREREEEEEEIPLFAVPAGSEAVAAGLARAPLLSRHQRIAESPADPPGRARFLSRGP